MNPRIEPLLNVGVTTRKPWMPRRMMWLCCVVVFAGLPVSSGMHGRPTTAIKSRWKNVLFLVVDDMRPNIGAYNASFAYTPNMDRLASEGTTFTRAYANYAYCSPSRNSFMTGRVPDVTRAYNFINHFREEGIGNEWRTLPEYFKEFGYTTLMAGKVFHRGLPPRNDYPRSWSETPTMNQICSDGSNLAFMEAPQSQHRIDEEEVIYNSSHGNTPCIGESTNSYCAANVSLDEQDDSKKLVDQRVREQCIEHLRFASRARNGPGHRRPPFFVACGFHRPHTPWVFPASILKHIREDVSVPKYPHFPQGIPLYAYSTHGALAGLSYKFNTTQDSHLTRLYRRGYYASIAWADYNIGKVVDTLTEIGHERDTVVVVTADHGFALGEMGMWTKMTNFEFALRVPLIFRTPWLSSSVGIHTSVIAELVDLYPTLVEIAGLPNPRALGENLSGMSLAQALYEPNVSSLVGKHWALSQFAKPSLKDPVAVSTEMRKNEVQVMGYSIRMERYRYTAWFEFDSTNLTAVTTNVLGRELYDFKGVCAACFDFEPGGTNLADREDRADVVRRAHRFLVQKIHRSASTTSATS